MRAEYFFELSGEHDTMCATEALRCAGAEDADSRFVASGPGYVVVSMDSAHAGNVAGRIALTRHIGKHLGSFDPSDLSGFGDLEIPDGTFAVRCKRFRGMMPETNAQGIIDALGDALSGHHGVNLKDPDNEIRIVMSDCVHVFLNEYSVDREDFEERKVGNRPFFSPISLHPKYARALINMTGARKGDLVLDPFCGTGGIAIEAALMGFRTAVSDFDPEMVAGTRENMDHYGLELSEHCVCDISDIPDCFQSVERIATDPPYGRSTHTGGEKVDSIYDRALGAFSELLRPGGTAGIVLPHPIGPPEGMRQVAMEIQRVHRSLSRHYHVFEKC